MSEDTRIRMQKWVSQLGLTSRREAERWMQEGRLKLNGQNAPLGAMVDPSSDTITLDGKDISVRPKAPKVYWLLNKPDQTLTSRKSQGEYKTIYDLDRLRNLSFQVNPVGRLDYRTEGLLLMTNDGELSNRLCHPKYKVPRHYQALVTGKLSEQQLKQLRKGVQLKDGLAKCKINYVHGKNLGKSRGSWYFITVEEGRNRLVRRLMEHFDEKVVRLIRHGFGDLKLDSELKPGEYRQLSSEEIRSLKNS